MKVSSVLVLAASCAAAAADQPLRATFDVMSRLHTDPKGLAAEVQQSPLSEIFPVVEGPKDGQRSAKEDALPIVVAHGMGDSCFNPGMQSITRAAGEFMGVYSVCPPVGKDVIEDTLNGFFIRMDRAVDMFAEEIQNDPNLAGGFNAFGLSQGNSLIRGYIQRYNDPPVKNFLSIHGTIMGVAGFPQCDPEGPLGPVCQMIDELLGELAYTELTQEVLFQAGYYRDPTKVQGEAYKTHSVIAQWNNERVINQEYKDNFLKTETFNHILARQDTMIFPTEGQWWGEYTQGEWGNVKQMRDTPMYQADLFGLRTADSQNRINFNTTDGNHLQFTNEQLFGWLEQYF